MLQFAGAVDQDAEKQMMDALAIDEPWGLIEAFSKWVRESTSADEKQSYDYIEGRLKSLGVSYQRFNPEMYISLPKAAGLEVKSPEQKTIRVKTISFSASTPPGGIEAELVYIGGAQATNVETLFDSNIGDVDVKGKISLCEGFGMPSKIAELEKAGALAQIYINPGENIHDGMASPVWGSPGLDNRKNMPKLPIVSVNNPDGCWLIEQCQQGTVTVNVSTELDEGWKHAPVIEATVLGSEEPEKYVLVHGHVDSWGIGIGDNAVGDATLLELARVFNQHRGQLKRTLKIAWWTGHSTGRYAGSAWYADEFAKDLDENCIAQVNIESPGCRGATSYEDVFVMPESEAFCTHAIKDVSGQTPAFMRPLRAGDYSFNNIGISSFYMLLSTIPADEKKRLGLYPVGGCGGNIAWHTEDDVLDIADKDNLINDLKVYVTSLRRVLNCELYPFDYRSTVNRMHDALKGYEDKAKQAGVDANFAVANSEFESLGQTLEKLYQQIDSDAVDKQRANRVLHQLSRQLVTLDNTTAPRFYHDPAMPRPSLPALAVANDLGDLDNIEKKFAQVDLRQGVNHVAGSIRQARAVLEMSLNL
jgi:hypothetical protein